jgi:hypothetical protein
MGDEEARDEPGMENPSWASNDQRTTMAREQRLIAWGPICRQVEGHGTS